MHTLHTYEFVFDHIPLTHDAAPVMSKRTISGLNMLDAQCRLKKILHRENRRMRLMHAMTRTSRPEPPAPLPKAYHEAMDLADHAKALLNDLERALA